MSLKRNVPGWERIARIIVGLAAAGVGAAWAFDAAWFGSVNLVGGVIVIASGLGFAATGAIGWCPMCAMVGRTLPKTDKVIKVAKY